MKTIGVFFYQGAGNLHVQALQKLGYLSLKIFANTDFSALDGVILPGGESSVQYDYCINNNLDKKIKEFALSKKPILGTCAGAILLSKYKSSQVNGLGLIDINIQRNYYGRQINSKIERTDSDNKAFMIRAPNITECGKKVKILDTLNDNPIFVKQDNIYCTIFHPELLTFDSKNPIKQIFK
ncbi:pyridoxal 5'-phosphate synthase glutaminase subunit PdxT [Rickettsiales endosymbiont of Trichoplax sp. H2]|uniref:pyridoxal 5'-phosphate synthase glutaminase subunit PdxT n=1 Tax=Rickettsiales endosymbiont of Trichoplax sp. H2 TaxID=2021221 RepID=UPI0012B1A93B|nr:pyridoxal 5'-phosphate synthase glutaminase subunit PdxT [Rickettsiales endosymbiont of Trichoplax sp. H2]MSO13784.1 Pyridoxal 5'-phosphate synthase subunit PdxT [Rickettsiales endosymbiont of Trichoplax sp. H2]